MAKKVCPHPKIQGLTYCRYLVNTCEIKQWGWELYAYKVWYIFISEVDSVDLAKWIDSNVLLHHCFSVSDMRLLSGRFTHAVSSKVWIFSAK